MAIIDSGGANIASLRFALDRLGARSVLTQDPEVISGAERVILPGVGAARNAMQQLCSAGLDSLIPQLKQPLLGICLGMQLLFDTSDEEATDCLAILPGTARLIAAAPGRPVPHMGWNQLSFTTTAPLLDGIPEGSHFYFVHSYAIATGPMTTATADYGGEFTAIVSWKNFCGTQFHPERSGKHGARLLHNFLQWHH